jgi:phage-related protein
MKPYFIYKGVSSEDMNIIINKLPAPERPQADILLISVQGRDGFLTIDNGTYQGTVKSCECSLDNGNIDNISSWLTGSGEVIFSNESDKKYKATIINKIPFSKIIPTFNTFIIQFECQPYKYSIDENIITLKSAGIILNNGVLSKPVITVYGTGNIDLSINDNTIHLKNIVDYVTIDSELMDCYKDTILKNNDMLGEFPTLQSGSNFISWTGTVSKIEIKPKWRWL